jgi:hypothetical protein
MLCGLCDAVFILDSDTVEILDCNPAASDVFGYSRGEMLGRTTTFLHVDEAALEEFRRHLYPAIEEKGFLQQFKFRMKRKDGSVFPTEHDVTPLIDERGNRVGWVSVVREITEREAAQQRLGQAAEEWARTLDSVTDLVFLIDSDFRLLRVNKAVANAFSRKPEELVGKHCYEIVHGIDGPVPYCPHRKALKTGEAASAEFFEPHLGIHLEVSTSPIFNDKGEVTGSVHTAKDITERKRVEQALRETKEIWHAIYVQSPIGIGMATLDGKIVSANQAMQTITGYSFEELQHINLAVTYENPEDRKRLLNILAQHGSVADYVTRLKPKDGTPYDALLNVAHVCFNGDDVLQTTCIDITEHKKVEEALRKSEERYRSLVEASHAGVAASDLEGKFTFVNNALCQMIGYSKDEMIGSRFIDFIHPDDRSRILQAFQAAPTSSRSVVNLEFRVVCRNGEVVHLFASPTPLKDGDNIVGAIAIIVDVTERKQVEEKLRESERKLTTLFEILPVGVSILDIERNIIYMNPALESILDISRAGLLKGDYRSRAYLRPDVTPMPAEEFASARAIKERMAVHNVETGVVKEDGNVVWTSVSAVPVAFLDWKAVIVTSDITERKRAEEALKDSEQYFRTLFEQAGDSIYVLDIEGKHIVNCNRIS